MCAKLNDTSSYHEKEMETLGWELTVCNSLEPRKSPCRSILNLNKTFGNLLYDFLVTKISFPEVSKIIEIGGGYGYVMRDFLSRHSELKAVMLDISPYLLKKQKETLKDFDVRFILKDFFSRNADFFSDFHMAILNENIGDFPTVCSIRKDELKNPSKDSYLFETARFVNDYYLQVHEKEEFNFNLGALQAIEKLCSSGVKYIYVSEHSCEASAPHEISDKLKITATGNPEQIKLKGHDEYTIKFSYLEKIARHFNYTVVRGNFTDFIKVNYTDKVNFILNSGIENDEHEIIRHFIHDLYKYEYLVLTRD